MSADHRYLDRYRDFIVSVIGKKKKHNPLSSLDAT